MPPLSLRRRSLVVALVLGGAVSCSEPTAPPPPEERMEVAATLALLEGPFYAQLLDGSFHVHCNARLRATGAGTGRARWTGYTVNFFALNDRSTPVAVSHGNGSAFWPDTLAPGEYAETVITASADVPFAMDVVLRYVNLPSTVRDSATVLVRCEPPFPADADTPLVDALEVLTGGTVELGDSVRFRYTASAEAGLFTTTARLTGSCAASQTFLESGIATVTRTVAFAVPPDCDLDDSLNVVVHATDAMTRVATNVAPIRLPVQDTRPPTLFAAFRGPNFTPPSGNWPPTPIGDFFTGDSLLVLFEARDNGLLADMTFTTAFAADTAILPVESSGWWDRRYLRLDDRWADGPEIVVRVRDRAGHESELTRSTAGSFRVHPTRNAASTVVPIAAGIVEPTVVRMHVSESLDLAVLQMSVIRIVDLVSRTVQRTVSLPTPAQGTDINPAGDSLFVFLADRSIRVLDLANPTSTLERLPIEFAAADTAGLIARDIRVLADGRLLLTVQRYNTDSVRAVVVERPATTLRFLDEFEMGGGELFRDRTGERVVLHTAGNGCRRRLHVASWTLGPATCDWFFVHRPVFIGADRFVLGGEIVDGTTGTRTPLAGPDGWWSIGGAPAADPDGIHLHYGAAVNDHSSYVRVRADGSGVVDRIRIPSWPAHAVVYDGRIVLVTTPGGVPNLIVFDLP